VFHQAYSPVGGSVVASALLAAVPLLLLFVMLAVLRMPAWLSASP
jgi:lactate permease